MKSAQRMHFLDGLRALAIAGVVLVHCRQMSFDVPPWLLYAAGYGAKGVQLFFVISGFTLTHIYHEKFPGFRDFIVRRVTRIVPMFYVGIVV